MDNMGNGKKKWVFKGGRGSVTFCSVQVGGKKMKVWPRVGSSHKKLIAVLSYIYTGSGKDGR